MGKSFRLVTFLLIFLCSGSLLVSIAGAGFDGYTVEPVTPGMDTGTPAETVPISFWDLPPLVMAITLAVSLSPIIAFPIELFIFIKLFIYLGYRKVTHNTIFDNATRNRIYNCIQNNPGIFFNALMRMTGVKRGTLRYHIIILKLNGEIAVLDLAGNTRYFENSGRYSEMEKNVLKYIRNDTDCRIFRLLLENSKLTRKDLGEHLGLSLSTVSWRMKRLNEAGIISVQKFGKNVRYRIKPDMRQFLKKYLVLNQEPRPIISLENNPESA